MAATPYLVLLPTQDKTPARSLVNGVEAMVVMAGSAADALAMAKAQFQQDVDALWGQSTQTAIVADTSIHGWTLDIVINNADGTLKGEITKTADGVVDASVKATGSVNLTGGAAADGDTFVIAGKTYTLQTVLTNTDGHVLIGANASASIANLVAAITLGAGSGAVYAAATTANASVTAVVDVTTTVADITALVAGTAGNAITLAKTGTNEAVSAATLTGGLDAGTIDALASAMATAINAAGLGITHSSYNAASQLLTVASAADNIGDRTLVVKFMPANRVRDVGIPGLVGAITAGGVAGAALTVALAADNYTIPLTAAGMRLVSGTLVAGAMSGASGAIVSLNASNSEGMTLNNGVDTAVVFAGSAADAKAYAQAMYAENMPAPWAGVTPAKIAAAADLTGWKVNVQVVRVSDGVVRVNQTYKGVTADTIDLVAAGLVTLLNADASALIANASYNAGTNVLTVAGAADGLGDHQLVWSWVAPASNESLGIPGFVTAHSDKGAAGAALTLTFAADGYTIPQVCAQLRRS